MGILIRSQSGFSLIGVLAAVAAAGVLGLTLMQMAQLSAQIKAMSEEGLTVQSQVFIAQKVLSDPETCRLNFGGTVISADRIELPAAPKMRNGTAVALAGPIFLNPEGEKNRFLGHHLTRIQGLSTIVNYNMIFSRNKVFGADATTFRQFPLSVTLNAANEIQSCSAGSETNIPDSPGPNNPTDTLGKLLAGACDEAKNPMASSSRYLPMPSAAAKKSFCAKLTYPIPASGPVVGCPMIVEYAPTSVVNGRIDNPIGGWLNRYLETKMHRQTTSTGYAACLPGAPVGMYIQPQAVARLGGLNSKEECEKVPDAYSGMALSIPETVLGGEAQVGMGDGASATCVDGHWM